MTTNQFNKIALMGREGVPGVIETLNALITHLQQLHCEVVLETSAAEILKQTQLPIIDADNLAHHANLLIVVGGDGSLLNAAHIAVDNDLPVLGINRGRLGFLTDIHPNELEKIDAILAGEFQQEQRFLLSASIEYRSKLKSQDIALNDVVLLPGDIAQMIEFDLFVDERLVCHHRADGMIIATPTGSTAYALSGGGPILYPNLDAVVMVPMFPHTLSSRPIVVNANSTISIEITHNNDTSPYVSCDGLNRVSVNPGDHIKIHKMQKMLTLIHPKDYNYFHTLREKLFWEKQARRPA